MTKKNNYRNAGRKKVVNGRKITKTIPEHLIAEFKKFADLWLKSKENEKI